MIFLSLGKSSVDIFKFLIDERLSKERSSSDELFDLFSFSCLIILNIITLYDILHH
jgi:hypothetical protein